MRPMRPTLRKPTRAKPRRGCEHRLYGQLESKGSSEPGGKGCLFMYVHVLFFFVGVIF